MNLADRRAAPRIAVRAKSAVKLDGRLLPVDLIDISPTGARVSARAQAPGFGAPVKLYLRNGQALDAIVARHTDNGFAVAFSADPPEDLPIKTFFWKLESYVFASGAFDPALRINHGRHLPNESLVESCTVTSWSERRARIETPIRLALGSRIHLCGRTMLVREKRGQVYALEPPPIAPSL